MEIIEYVESLDNKFSSITKDYKYIYDNIHNYLNDGKVSYNQIMDFEISLEDLSIHINSLAFLFKQKQNESNTNISTSTSTSTSTNTNTNINTNNNSNSKTDTENKIDYILDKTIFQFIPLLFIYFMIFDKESILYIKDFIESKTPGTLSTQHPQYPQHSQHPQHPQHPQHTIHISSIPSTISNHSTNNMAFLIEAIDE